MRFETTEGEHENPDRSGQWADTMTTATRYQSYETTRATYETVDTCSRPRAPDHEYVYARADEAVRTTSEQ